MRKIMRIDSRAGEHGELDILIMDIPGKTMWSGEMGCRTALMSHEFSNRGNPVTNSHRRLRGWGRSHVKSDNEYMEVNIRAIWGTYQDVPQELEWEGTFHLCRNGRNPFGQSLWEQLSQALEDHFNGFGSEGFSIK